MNKVVIIDDHPIVRQGFVLLINQEEDLEVVGEAEDAPTAVDLVQSKKPSMMKMYMPSALYALEQKGSL